MLGRIVKSDAYSVIWCYCIYILKSYYEGFMNALRKHSGFNTLN